MSEKIVIRRMTEADLDQVCGIENEAFSIPWSRKSFRDFIVRDDAVFLTASVCRDGDEMSGSHAADCKSSAEIPAENDGSPIAGYIGFYGIPDEGDITNVAVRKDMRGRGIGGMLVSALISEASRRGISRIFLEVRESNDAAIHVYLKSGFRRVGLRKNYYDDPVENAVIMLRDEEDIR